MIVKLWRPVTLQNLNDPDVEAQCIRI